ncbi:MAG: AIPR family protein [Myxococcales bacterium]|nr:AIPR family protein [Myxococcales bacterium]
MTLTLSIIHQRVESIRESHPEALGPGDVPRLRTRAFTALVTSTVLDVPLEEAFEYLTDGGQDGGIDAIAVGSVRDAEFVVTLVQTKYKQRSDGESAFPASEIPKLRMTVGALFDPAATLELRPQLMPRIEEIRSLVRDGYIPSVRIVLANNGKRWGADADQLISSAKFPADQVRWEHINHDSLVAMLRPHALVNDELQLQGEAVVESFDFCRVLVGKVGVTELARLFDAHGDRLLERNVRRYLGLRNNRVNKAIAATLRSREERDRFYFYNNGVTLTCSKFRHNALQAGNHLVKLEQLQVINGGQTCHTIRRTLAELTDEDFSRTFVLVRVYELDDDQRELVHQITYATNSQNPVDLRDLRANDEVQRDLELGLADLGYVYARKRSTGTDGRTITPAQTAEAVLAIWRRKPHLARSGSEALFGQYYSEVFDASLTPRQVVLAVEILRRVRIRLRTSAEGLPRFAPYAAHFIAMLVGDSAGDIGIEELEAPFESLFSRAVVQTRMVLLLLGVSEGKASLQRLSATFRRGALLEQLPGTLEEIRTMAAAHSRKVAELEALYQRHQELAVAVKAAQAHTGSLFSELEELPHGSERYVDHRRELDESMASLNASFALLDPSIEEIGRITKTIDPREEVARDLLAEFEALDG